MSLTDLLTRAYDRDHLGHALLFVSSEERSDSFSHMTLDFICTLLCIERKKGENACGHCESCLLLRSTYPPPSHPDALWLEPENATGYSVDQIRELHSRFSLHLSLSPNRVIWLKSAEALAAGGGAPANAFLKILEEPRPKSFLILSTSHAEAVLPTLRSRCQSFRFPKISADNIELSDGVKSWADLLGWLEKGAPLAQNFQCPADQEDFWSERAEAVAELEEVHLKLWKHFKNRWESLEREGALRVMDFFHRFESLILRVRGYANPHLQWLSLRSDAKLGNLWKP